MDTENLFKAHIEINLDPRENGFVFRREGGKVITNVSHIVERHSPTGLEFGYGGSGPSDAALNLLLMARHYCDFPVLDEAIDASYQEFKWKFIANLPEEGGVIPLETVIEFLKEKAQGFEKKL